MSNLVPRFCSKVYLINSNSSTYNHYKFFKFLKVLFSHLIYLHRWSWFRIPLVGFSKLICLLCYFSLYNKSWQVCARLRYNCFWFIYPTLTLYEGLYYSSFYLCGNWTPEYVNELWSRLLVIGDTWSLLPAVWVLP